jgi:hypothetical protein
MQNSQAIDFAELNHEETEYITAKKCYKLWKDLLKRYNEVCRM